MRTFKDAWFILTADVRADKWRLLYMFLYGLLFVGYLSLMTSAIIGEIVGEWKPMLFGDYLLLTMTPVMGFTFSRHAFKYLSDNSYTRMVAYLRSLPVPFRTVMLKRKLQALLTFLFHGSLYFGGMYAVAKPVREQLPVSSYMAFSLTWIGYGLAMTGLFIFLEFMVSGKAYFWLTMGIVVLTFGVSFLVYVCGGNLLIFSAECSLEWSLLSPLMWGMLATGIVSLQLFALLTERKVRFRDLE
ncbi:hypothetical protein ACE6ED_16620 [Paenibacillus sp. CN-4]|uniref:hypothetical protein n=1 Tax=Paenibacillus nanchangensis TaxID=3348343 RepID=UPI00397DE8E0